MTPNPPVPVASDIEVTVSFSPHADMVDEVVLRLPDGATVADAIAASGLQERHAALDLSLLPIGVWGALCEPRQPLRGRDRVELYRPLTVDPKEARRLRYRAATKLGRVGK